MRKRLLTLTMAFCMAISLLPVTARAADENWIASADTSWYTGHESAASYTLSDAADLAGLAKLVNEGPNGSDPVNFQNKTINLAADIDLGGKEWTPIGTKDKPFKGTFDGTKTTDGDGKVTETYTISKLTVNGSNYLGLFGATNGATISNLTLSNVNVTTERASYLGTLAGKADYGTIDNITVNTAKVTNTSGDYVGGLVGDAFPGTIQNCMVDHLTIDVKAAFVGGIAGQGYADINNCTVQNSSITSSVWKIGGIVGQLNEEEATLSRNKVLDTAITNTNDSTSDFYSGTVGGLIGFSNKSDKTLTNNTVERVTITSCISAGGLIGSVLSEEGDTFTFSDCVVKDLTFKWDGEITRSGGLIGEKYW